MIINFRTACGVCFVCLKRKQGGKYISRCRFRVCVRKGGEEDDKRYLASLELGVYINAAWKTGCKKCDACRAPECLQCENCLQKSVFAGSAKWKEKCIMRICELSKKKRKPDNKNPSGNNKSVKKRGVYIKSQKQRKVTKPERWVDGKYICSICKEDFGYPAKLNYHQKSKHGMEKQDVMSRTKPSQVQETDYECRNCGKKLQHESDLKDHMQIHMKSFCDLCDSKLEDNFEYLVHMRKVHKLHECPECGKKLKKKSHLDEHLLVHRGLYPYKCPKCDWGFRRKNKRNTHLDQCKLEMEEESFDLEKFDLENILNLNLNFVKMEKAEEAFK